MDLFAGDAKLCEAKELEGLMPCRPVALGEVDDDFCSESCCCREYSIYYKQLSGLWFEIYIVQSELLIVIHFYRFG